MKAVLLKENGNLSWENVECPEMGAGDVKIQVCAAALNRADLLQRAGQYPPPPGWPKWFGLEAAGIIVDMGEEAKAANRFSIGDRVCALLGGGGYAEYVCAPEGMVMPIPKGIDMDVAAALPEVFGAAYLFLFVEGKMKPGDTILVQAGASGLASVLIPMAKAFGARVITTVLTDEIAAAIGHLKADRVVVTAHENLAQVMLEEKNAGHGVDICVDCLGGETVGECLPCMNHGGRWIIIATLAGDPTHVDLRKMYVNGTRLIGTTLRSRSSDEKRIILENLVHDVWPKIDDGSVRPTIWRIYPIEQADEAQQMMAAGKNIGKIALHVCNEQDVRL